MNSQSLLSHIDQEFIESGHYKKVLDTPTEQKRKELRSQKDIDNIQISTFKKEDDSISHVSISNFKIRDLRLNVAGSMKP